MIVPLASRSLDHAHYLHRATTVRKHLAQPAPSIAEVHEVLTGHPAFVQVDQGRWQLGEPAWTLPPS
jgi:hypothetical protein